MKDEEGMIVGKEELVVENLKRYVLYWSVCRGKRGTREQVPRGKLGCGD